MSEKNSPLIFGNTTISPGERITIALPTPELYTCTPMHIPIHIIHGKRAGPTLLICSGMHGDEMNGIAIIQKLLNSKSIKSISGTIIAIPVMNVYGLMTHTRNLPDKRDLESSFPGSEQGTFADRLAYSLNTKIFDLATHIIHIQTGEPHYHKFPQVQTNTFIERSSEMAKEFGTPFIKHTESDKGLLWKLKELDKETAVINYEAGHALSLDDRAIRIGFNGIIRIMRAIELISSKHKSKTTPTSLIRSSTWIRSPSSGISKILKKSGSQIKKNELIAIVTDPFGTKQTSNIYSPLDGVIISNNIFPLTNEGDPLLELAPIENFDPLHELRVAERPIEG